MPSDTERKFRHWQTRTILATMVGYALFYFVRKNFSMAMPGMEQDLGISKTVLGAFLTANGLIYGFSRFLNGLVADRFNARVHMSVGLVLCAASNALFGFMPELVAFFGISRTMGNFTAILALFMGVAWLVNGFLQGSGFPPCARLLTHWIPPKELATKMSVWNTSHSIGAGLVVILCGYIMAHLGSGDLGEKGLRIDAWRWCFWIPAAISGAGAVVLYATLRDTPTSVGLPELPGTEIKLRQKPQKTEKSAEYRAFLREKVFCNPLIWILATANFFVYVVRFSVLDWGPALLQQSKGVTMTKAGWLVALFEIAGIVGMLASGWVTDRWLKGRAHRTCVFCMAGATLCAVALWLIPGTAPTPALFAVLCATGFFIYGPQALVGIAAANQATKKAAATANGVTGIFGYASTALSGIGFGYIAEHHGWNLAYIVIIALSLVGAGVFALMWRAPTHGYAETTDNPKPETKAGDAG
ncbi:MAG: MFS transporter [Opitutaceae bacterium]|jgi:OPA family glycerol-3-phosphate transporter-like MFS transporter/OPA family sugar phosphate sensor protein UhpC-like MFS transporter|nr:MFS transporter [Opitutaceae bacterium]